MLRRPLPAFTRGGWSGFGTAVDLVIAIPVSWIPLAADYSRHSKTPRAAFFGSVRRFRDHLHRSTSRWACSPSRRPFREAIPASALLAVPVAGIAVLVLVLDETKEAFANLYSTAISAQNLIPSLDRRIVAGVVGAGATAVGLLIDLTQYESYLYLIGSVFVPLFGVFAVNYYVLAARPVGRLRVGPRPAG